MKLELKNIEKEDIVLNYGSDIENIDAILSVLNDLDIVEETDDFFELICLIALDIETENNSTLNKECGIKRSLKEIIIIIFHKKINTISNTKQH